MPLVVPNLDDKNFDQFFDEAQAALPSYSPEWTEYNLSDPGITIVELFAWLSDINMYRLNYVGSRHHLKYLKLLDAVPTAVKPAECLVTFTSSVDMILEKGEKLLALDMDKNISIAFETIDTCYLIKSNLRQVKLNNERGEVTLEDDGLPKFFYPFGMSNYKNSSFSLIFDDILPDEFSVTFMLYEKDLPEIGSHQKESTKFFPSVEVVWEYSDGTNWQELTVLKDETVNFSKSGTIIFHKNEKTVKEIRCKVYKGSFEQSPRIEKILTNTVLAKQVEQTTEVFEKFGKGFAHQKIELKNYPLTEIELKIDEEIWEEVDTLQVAKYNQKCYELDKNSGVIRFGDGEYGKTPPVDAKVVCIYKNSLGAKGNIYKESLWKIENNSHGLSLTNYFDANAGENPQTIDEAFVEFKKSLSIPSQAVTEEDYRYLTLHTPGLRVARAKAIADIEKNEVTVIVVPFSFKKEPYPSEGFLKSVCYHLDKHRLITTKIKTITPTYVKVTVHAQLSVVKTKHSEEVKKRVLEKLNTFLDPITGWKDQKGWPFGQSVYESDIYALIENIDGVDCVLDLYLSAVGENISIKNGNIEISQDALVSSNQHQLSIFTTQESCRGML